MQAGSKRSSRVAWMVFVLTQIWDVVPPWAFFITSALLIFAAILIGTYVGWLYKHGRVHTLWPVKLLRFTISLVVTTFYSNVLQFAIFPVNCYTSSELRDNLTWLLQSSSACAPFAPSIVGVTIVSLLLALLFVTLGLTAAYLGFEINPLSRHPMAYCTGRVEAAWILFKTVAVVAVFCTYLSKISLPSARPRPSDLYNCHVYCKAALSSGVQISFDFGGQVESHVRMCGCCTNMSVHACVFDCLLAAFV
jgi:hypothetical protein